MARNEWPNQQIKEKHLKRYLHKSQFFHSQLKDQKKVANRLNKYFTGIANSLVMKFGKPNKKLQITFWVYS